METPKEEILEFMKTRPGTVGIIGYGSGVNPQSGQEGRKPQIDLIVIVDDLKKWHKDNIKKNPHDYSFSGRLFFGHAPLSWLKAGGKICYMTYIPFNGRKYKLGTIEKTDFLNDLRNWETFYMAGRMQKPILIVQGTEDIVEAIEYNRYAGIMAAKMIEGSGEALLKDFYITLASLSYIGDTRMGIAENPDKVKNIVNGRIDFYDEYYGANLVLDGDKVVIEDNIKIDTLPDELGDYLAQHKDVNTSVSVKQFLTGKNKSQSLAQTVKGLFTTGPIKSVKYVGEKLKRKKKK